MACTVNLCAWRAARRRRCVHLWGAFFISVGLILILLIVCWRQAQLQWQEGEEIRETGHRELLQVLVQREKQFRAEQAGWKVAQKFGEQLEATRRWQLLLGSLAQTLPEQTWLTALQWQGGTLSFAGLANRFADLATLDKAIRSLPGFASVAPGALLQDQQGRWQFSYQLVQGDANVGTR